MFKTKKEKEKRREKERKKEGEREVGGKKKRSFPTSFSLLYNIVHFATHPSSIGVHMINVSL